MRKLTIILLLSISGCAGLPSVGACRVAEYKRLDGIWSMKFEDCRVIQSGGAAGLVGAAIPGL
jgi:hypothetical protein